MPDQNIGFPVIVQPPASKRKKGQDRLKKAAIAEPVSLKKGGKLSLQEEARLSNRIRDERTGILQALCSYPPALRVIQRWYSCIAEGRVSPFKVGYVSAKDDIAQVRFRSGRIANLAGALASADCNDKPGLELELLDALRFIRPLDRNLAKLVKACIAASPEHPNNSILLAGIRKTEKLKDLLLKHNMGLCIKAALSWKNCNVPIEDLVQEGSLGLIWSIERYDPSSGNRLSTFAMPTIKNNVLIAIHDQSRLIRLPVDISKRVAKLKRAELDLERKGQKITPELLASKTNLTPQQVQDCLDIPIPPVSIEEPSGGSGISTYADTLVDVGNKNPIDKIFSAQRACGVAQAINDLQPRSRQIAVLRFGFSKEEHSLVDIGRQIEVSPERVRQLEGKLLKSLKAPLRAFAQNPEL